MHSITGNNITLSRGDTMSVTFHSGKTDWTDADRAIFTVKDVSGNVMLEKVTTLDENGDFTVDFFNGTTDGWTVGSYNYDVRYVVGALFDEDGNVVDGTAVYTPADPATITIKTTVGEV